MPGSGGPDPATPRPWGGLETAVLFLVFTGPPAFRRRGAMDSVSGEIDLAVAVQLAAWALAATWVAVQFLGARTAGRRLTTIVARWPWPLWGGLVLTALLALSARASPGPGLTLVRSAQMGVAALVGYLMVEQFGIVRSLLFLRRVLAVLGYALFVSAVLWPGLVLRNSPYFGIRGDAIGPTAQVGMMLFVLALVWPFPPSVRPVSTGGRVAAFLLDRREVLIVEAACLVLLARSRVGILLLVLVLLVLIARAVRESGLRNRLGWLLATLAGLALIAVGRRAVLDWVLRDPKQLKNLSQRLPLWSHLTEATMAESPLFGLGFIASSRVLGPEVNPHLANAHSSFVEVLVGGGLIAAILFAGLWLWLLSSALAAAVARGRLGLSLLLLSVVLFAFAATTSHLVNATPTALAFWLLVAILAAPRRLEEEARAHERPPKAV